MRITNPKSLVAGIALAGLAAGCGTADKLATVGQEPALNAIQDPTSTPGYRPVQMPMPDPVQAHYSPNSLWQSGSRAFFKDQRAAVVGDILTVLVTVNDEAEIANSTNRSRTDSNGSGVGGALGTTLDRWMFTNDSSSADIASVNSNSSFTGTGGVDREETLETTVAAVVTQVLPNGNLVIEGRQEIRVNFEVRELIVAGIVRPEDITANNTISSQQIAEARIGYGGRGQITDVQQPRYGNQVLDIILPF